MQIIFLIFKSTNFFLSPHVLHCIYSYSQIITYTLQLGATRIITTVKCETRADKKEVTLNAQEEKCKEIMETYTSIQGIKTKEAEVEEGKETGTAAPSR